MIIYRDSTCVGVFTKEELKYKAQQILKKLNEADMNILQYSAHGVMVTVAGNGHGDTSSNPGRDWLHFT